MKNNSEKRWTYDICSDVLTGSRSSSQQRDISDGPIRSVADLSPAHREVSAAVRSPRRRQRAAAAAAAADRQRLTSAVTTVPATVGNGVLKEEPVQFPVTIHTAAAYFVTTIKLYATFSIYFRVRCFICVLSHFPMINICLCLWSSLLRFYVFIAAHWNVINSFQCGSFRSSLTLFHHQHQRLWWSII